MSKKALIVGINYTGTDAELSGCLNDAKNMYWLLRKRFGFQRSNIAGLLEKEATHKNIINGLKWLVSESKAGDALFFSYSGHGGSRLDRNLDEKDGRDETIIPYDWAATGEIIDDEIRSIISKIPEGVKFFGLFDSCHSGTIMDLKYSISKISKTNSGDYSYQNINDVRKNDYKGKVICISGCLDGQTSADTFEAGMYRGAMTWAFEKVIHQYQDPNLVPIVEILFQMRKVLSESKYSQTVQLGTSFIVLNTTKLDL